MSGSPFYDQTLYNTEVVVQYNTNLEYRRCLRDIFRMNMTKRIETLRKEYGEKWDTFEDDTQDELLFDEGAAEQGIAFLYELTNNIPEFRELFLKAAATMISEDVNMGLVILLSYDYLPEFHQCMVSFLTSDSDGPILSDITRSWIDHLTKRFTR